MGEGEGWSPPSLIHPLVLLPKHLFPLPPSAHSHTFFHTSFHTFSRIDPVIVKGLHLDHYKGYNFWRFDILTTTGDDERTFEYKIQVGSAEITKPK